MFNQHVCEYMWWKFRQIEELNNKEWVKTDLTTEANELYHVYTDEVVASAGGMRFNT